MRGLYGASVLLPGMAMVITLSAPVAGCANAKLAPPETKAPKAKPAAKGQINGILIGPGEAPEANKEVLLVEANVLDLTGKKVERLKERTGTQILDRGDVVAKAKTDKLGRFEFKGVAGGRYCVCVWSDGGDRRLITLRGQDGGRTVVLDLAEGEEAAVGMVLVREE